MSTLNQCQFIGNLGADPEMRFTPSGNPVATFNLACSRTYKDSAGVKKEETEWVTVVTWDTIAESCNQYLTKGAQVYVSGRWHTRSWLGQDGEKRYKTEVIARQVQFLSKKPVGDPPAEPAAEEIPF